MNATTTNLTADLTALVLATPAVLGLYSPSPAVFAIASAVLQQRSPAGSVQVTSVNGRILVDVHLRVSDASPAKTTAHHVHQAIADHLTAVRQEPVQIRIVIDRIG